MTFIQPWLTVESDVTYKDEVVIARSFRYRAPTIDYGFLKSIANISFVGLPAEYEDMKKAGIIDPTKVTRVALENAASIAGMFLTTECVISDIKEETPAAPMMNPGMGGTGSWKAGVTFWHIYWRKLP